MKRIIVLGAGGFIGGHLVKRLKSMGHWVRGVDLKAHEFNNSPCDEFLLGDLTYQKFCHEAMYFDSTIGKIDEVYQLAADMGGAEYIFTGENDANIMHNSALINLNVLRCCLNFKIPKIFYSSSACIYPEHNQLHPDTPNCEESSAYPANPDSEYGWEKLFSERLYLAYAKNFGIQVRIARFHNIFGPYGTWCGGKEKAPAAICRKVAECVDGGTVDIFGDGKQTRSFLFIDECVEGVLRLMESDFVGPVNIGSEEMVSINQLVEYVAEISGKKININHIKGPLGVRGRNSHNKLLREKLGWEPKLPLKEGLKKTYNWINSQILFQI
jgi:GDP-D-mannose 3',5'-epimerase